MNAYEAQGLTKSYGTRTALALDGLAIRQGAILGLVGPNGSGKSTLLRLLALVEQPSAGRLLFQGQPADLSSLAQRRRVSLLLQEPYLLKRSVFDNVAYGLKVRGETGEARRRVAEALGLVGLDPASFAGRPWRALSGGEAQRVALAARLILRPEVLLLDEPTASVDEASAGLIQAAVLQAQRDWGTTLILASHDRPWLDGLAEEIVQLRGGRMAV